MTESIHFRHPGGTPEDEADAVNAPRAQAFMPQAVAKAAASLGETRARDAVPPSMLLFRKNHPKTVGGRRLASPEAPEAAPPLAAAPQLPARATQPRRSLSPQTVVLCAFAAAVSMLLHAGSVLEGADSWLLLTQHLCWVCYREAHPAHAAAWIVATCCLGATVAGRCDASACRITRAMLTPTLRSAYLARAVSQVGGDAAVFWNGPRGAPPRKHGE